VVFLNFWLLMMAMLDGRWYCCSELMPLVLKWW